MHGQIFDLVGPFGVMDAADEALCLFVLAGSLTKSITKTVPRLP